MFSCPIQIRLCDLDPFNHVNNGSQCHLLDYGRTQYFEHVFEMKINWLTFDLIVVHIEIDFKKPIRIHDKILCETDVYELGNSSIKMLQRLVNADTNEIMTVCHVVLVTFDREKNVSKPIPQEYRDKLADYEKPKIKNIIFDFGGVLIDWNPHYLIDEFDDHSREIQILFDIICSRTWNNNLDIGYSFPKACQELKDMFPKYEHVVQAMIDRWDEMLGKQYQKSVELIYKLKSKGYKIYGLSNWCQDTIHYAFEKFSFFKDFDGILVSGFEKIAKPNPKFYKLLLNKYDLKASESLFIDDRIENVEGARKVGISTILFDDENTIEKKVSQLIDSSFC